MCNVANAVATLLWGYRSVATAVNPDPTVKKHGMTTSKHRYIYVSRFEGHKISESLKKPSKTKFFIMAKVKQRYTNREYLLLGVEVAVLIPAGLNLFQVLCGFQEEPTSALPILLFIGVTAVLVCAKVFVEQSLFKAPLPVAAGAWLLGAIIGYFRM